jgi:hypothetical protein
MKASLTTRAIVIALFAVTIIATKTAHADWISSQGDNIPPKDAAVGGYEKSGEPLFICRAEYKGAIHPGKFRKGLGGCRIGWGDQEIPVPTYETMTLPWKPEKGGDIDSSGSGTAVSGGIENNQPLYICRANYQGGMHIGKLRKDFGGCRISWNNKEHSVAAYEVLHAVPNVSTGCPTPVSFTPLPSCTPSPLPQKPCVQEWVSSNIAAIPPDAVIGGYEQSGEPLFICRAVYKGAAHIGKIRKGFGGCKFGWGGQEITVPTYETMTLPWKKETNGDVDVSHGAVCGGVENNQPLYICRANYQGGMHIGKLRKDFGGCRISWGGKEIPVTDYEVLHSTPIANNDIFLGGDLAAADWCYEGVDGSTITFYPIIKNVGQNDWTSQEKGSYFIGATVNSISSQKNYELPAYPYFWLQKGETSKLNGISLVFHPNNTYGISNIWGFVHPNDTNSANNAHDGAKGLFAGSDFLPTGKMSGKMCK